MYFHYLHILYYVAFAIIGLIVGQIAGNFNQKIIDSKKSKQTKKKKQIEENPEKVKRFHYVIMILTSIIYVLLLYTHGLQKEFINNMELIQSLILTPFLLSVISIDRRLKIIPNRLVVTLFEIGIVLTFIYGVYDINAALERLTGGIIGIAVFWGIVLLGNLISGKETMGYGDVKLVGVLGLYFGVEKIMILSVVSFVICALVSVILMLFRKKKANEEIAFGPFIALATFVLMFIEFDMILYVMTKIFTLGLA